MRGCRGRRRRATVQAQRRRALPDERQRHLRGCSSSRGRCGADAELPLRPRSASRDFGAGYRIGVRCRHLPSRSCGPELARPKTVRWMSSDRPGSAVLVDMARALNPWEHWDTSMPTRGSIQELGEVSADLWRSVTTGWRDRQRRRMRRAARHSREIATRVWRPARSSSCASNIIRSAFAAGLLGVTALDGRTSDPFRRTRRNDESPADPTAVQYAAGSVDWARIARVGSTKRCRGSGYSLAMELDHVVEICRRFPQYRHKVPVRLSHRRERARRGRPGVRARGSVRRVLRSDRPGNSTARGDAESGFSAAGRDERGQIVKGHLVGRFLCVH